MKLSETQQNVEPEKKPADKRFQNIEFREAVRVVLEWFDLESNMGNFKRLEISFGKIDWIAWGNNISSNHPEPDFLDMDKFYKSCKEISG